MIQNVFLVQELIRDYGKANVSPRSMLQIDIHKAFDSISWEFLNSMLIALNFPPIFINWIMQCVTTTSFSISINGAPTGLITKKRGLRQGCPLSTFLFVIGLEYLSRSLNLLQFDHDFNFHPKCQDLNITHLSFADDLMLFCRGDAVSISKLMEKLNDFSAVSGLRINASKSKFYNAGAGNSAANTLDCPGFSQGSIPFRYLGIPLANYNLQFVHYSAFLNKLLQHVNFWKNAHLSYAGRVVLIKSVIQGLNCFWLSALPSPVKVIDQINRICTHFLWGSNDNGFKKAKVSWKQICLPKNEGGLGIMQLKSWNKALLVKNLWDLHLNKDLIWVK